MIRVKSSDPPTSSANKISSGPIFILAVQLIAIEAAAASQIVLPQFSALVVALATFSTGILIHRRNAPISLALCTIGSSLFAVIISSWAEKYSTIVACCIVTAVACAAREPAGASVAGILFAVIVVNDEAVAWDWDILYALVVAFLTSTFFSRVYAYAILLRDEKFSALEWDQSNSDIQIVATAWHFTVVHAND